MEGTGKEKHISQNGTNLRLRLSGTQGKQTGSCKFDLDKEITMTTGTRSEN
jgi:hypothetical protein